MTRTSFQPRRPLVIGLLGGIAAGKSAVAALFEEAGLVVLDADRAAREVVADPGILARIVDRFGPEVVGADGQLDRAALASRAFGSSTGRVDLEAITHPAIRARLEAGLAAAAAAGRSALLDVPLLLEGGLIARCDATVFVDVPEATRRARARARGWSDDELPRREAHQAPLDEKRARATYVLDNDRPLDEVRADVGRILAALEGAGALDPGGRP